jgi:hypothetical protein
MHRRHYTSEIQQRLLTAVDDIVAAKPYVQVAVVRMFEDLDGDVSYRYGQRCVIKNLNSIAFCHVHLAAFCEEHDWTLVPRRYVDRKGEFVEDEALDASENPLEILPDVERLFKRAMQT